MASPYSPGPSIKKHKKHHKSDKLQQRLDNSPKPAGLKLILKVGNQAATPEHSTDFGYGNNPSAYSVQDGGVNPEGDYFYSSTSLDGMKSHHKKSKKKKKKKDKSKDRERKHRHHHKEHHKEKKRKREDEPEAEPEGDTSTLGLGLGSPNQLHREPRTCVLRQRQERTSVQRMLDQLLAVLEKKDPQQFFAWPVTDNIAPGYSSIITQPMDFSTMRQKIEENQYDNLPDFLSDFKLMCTNAMKYNHVDTIYYKASKKLLHQGVKAMQPEKLGWLIGLVPELTNDDMGFEITAELRQSRAGGAHDDHYDSSGDNIMASGATGEAGAAAAAAAGCGSGGGGGVGMVVGAPKKKMPLTKFEPIVEELTPEEVLAKAQIAAREARAKLMQKAGKTAMGYLNQKKDGTTNLSVLVGGIGVIPGTKKRPVLLGSLCGKLNEGSAQLQGFREDRRNVAKPVKPLYYGAFGSYAPSYDSAFSNLTKEESDLVYQTYGSDTAVQYAESVLDFVKDSDYATHLVDSLLDLLTGGDHSKTRNQLDDNKRLRDEEEAVRAMLEVKPIDSIKVDVDELKSLQDLGIDVNFLETMEDEIKLGEERHELQQKLDGMCQLLQRLQQTQHQRLSQPPQPGTTQPSEEEAQVAEEIADNLMDMAKRVAPSDVAPVPGVRKAMGMPPPPQPPSDVVVPEVDLESELRQFLESEPALAQSPLRDDKTIEEILME